MADGEKISAVGSASRQAEAAVRSVSQAAFEILGDTPFESAVQEAVTWMRERNSAIPEDALVGNKFEVGGGGDAPAQAVILEFEGGRIWAASLDVPDIEVVGRTWVSEITVGELAGRVQFGTRLTNVTKRADPSFMPTLPAVARRIINKLSAHADSLRLTDSSFRVHTAEEVDDLIALLDDPTRQMPVVVLADGPTRFKFAAPDAVAKRIAGACHTVSLSEEGSWELTNRIGKSLSVFGGAARLYRPKFRSDRSDPFEHPLWLTRLGTTPASRRDALVARVLSSGVHGRHQEYPRFNVVREAAAKQLIERMRLTSSSTELSHLFEEENVRLTQELRALRSEYDGWLEDAEQTERKVEREINELKWELGRARLQNDRLRAAVSSGVAPGREKLLSPDGFEEWVRGNLSTNIWVAPKAIREFQKHCQFENLDLIADVLAMLDDIYVPMRRAVSAAQFERYRVRLAELGCEDQPCFGNRNDIKQYPEYGVSYQSNRYWCDQHIKFGGGTDPRRMFRVYYHWNEVENIVLIGHLPNHLDNNLTN